MQVVIIRLVLHLTPPTRSKDVIISQPHHLTTSVSAIMPPKAQLCLCKSHGCADTDRMSGITGQVLKGRYLGATEFRAHQRDEKSARRSACNLPLGIVENSSGTLGPGCPTHVLPTPLIHAHTSDTHTSDAADMPVSNSDALQQPVCQAEPTNNDISREISPHRPSVSEPPTEGLPSDSMPDAQEHHIMRIMQAIESCRLAFRSWQRVEISCQNLIFEEGSEEGSGGDPQPHPPLRADIMSNTPFIEYETVMFSLLDQIGKVKAGDYKECQVARQNVLSSIEDEIDRLRGVKLHVWRGQANCDGATNTSSSSRPLKIDTGT